MPRDDFSKIVIDVLAKRVGFFCSNPSCKRATVGPNSDPSKPTITGVGAHITAAAPGGPRYDAVLDTTERSSIDNGIWLCSQCATLIDKDPETYTVALLKEWKQNAENESNIRLTQSFPSINQPMPFLEADLIRFGTMRWNTAYSNKNPIEEVDGVKTMVFRPGYIPIIFWRLTWRYKIVVFNNSQSPAYNVRITQTSNIKLSDISKLPKINNLPPYQKVELDAEFEIMMESTYIEADAALKHTVPPQLEGLQLEISYRDNAHNEHSTISTINNSDLTNRRKNVP